MNNSNWFISSTGTGLSSTIGGLSIVGVAQAIALVLGLIGHPVSQDALSAGLTTIVTAVGAVYAAFGVLRKAYYWIVAIFQKQSA